MPFRRSQREDFSVNETGCGSCEILFGVSSVLCEIGFCSYGDFQPAFRDKKFMREIKPGKTNLAGIS